MLQIIQLVIASIVLSPQRLGLFFSASTPPITASLSFSVKLVHQSCKMQLVTDQV